MPIPLNIPALVRNLPELYQPVFGHPELSARASRKCDDRLEALKSVYTALAGKLDRPLNVLDLGCAQGYFSFRLAELGARVVGVDMLQANIRLCEALRTENPTLDLSFHTAKIEEFISSVADGQFDLVIALSVFHHLCVTNDINQVREILECLRDRTACSVFELASAKEPLPWAKHLPEDELPVLAQYPFRHVLGLAPTHLSDIARPIVVASSRFWVLGNLAGEIEESSTESHQYAQGTHQGTRRYFRGKGRIVKLFSLRGTRAELNRQELTNEGLFLENPPGGFAPIPKLHGWHVGESDAWLVRDELPGKLLSDVKPTTYSPVEITRDVLAQLAVLERSGLYHNDVRPWNTLLLPDGHATLIDYGAISRASVDCGSQMHPIYSFPAYLEGVATGMVSRVELLRFPFALISTLRGAYGSWIDRAISISWESWSYNSFWNALSARQQFSTTPAEVAAAEIKYLERFIHCMRERMAHLVGVLTEAEARADVREKLLQKMEVDLGARTAQVAELTARLSELEARATELDSLLGQANSTAQHEIDHKHRELTLRITDIQKLKALVDSLSSQLADVHSQLVLANQTAAEELQKKERDVVRAQRDADERMTQVETLTRMVRDGQAEQQDLRRQVQELTDRIHVIEPESYARYEQIKVLTQLLENAQAKLHAHEAKIERAKTAGGG